MMQKMNDLIMQKAFALHHGIMALSTEFPNFYTVARIIVQAFQHGNKLLICGNGGSAADAQHFAAELTGRFKKERRAYPAIALTTDTSALTAIANDYGYEYVFSRQLEALVQPNDILFSISTSGNSKNCINAMELAKHTNVVNIALLGGSNCNKMYALADHVIHVPGQEATDTIQEMHIFTIHTICMLIEEMMSK